MTKHNPLLLIFLIGGIVILACGDEKQETQIIRPVRYLQVYSTGGSRIRTLTGVAQAGMESKLSFKVPGTVKELPAHVGDTIRKGQLIAKLDDTDYKLQHQQAEAGLSQAQAQARNGAANYDRVRTLWENNSVSRSNLDAARAANESAQAGLKSAEKQLELARLQLSYTGLIAPVNGSIAAVNIELNENVQAGLPVVILTSDSQIEVRLSIPEILISQIKEGANVTAAFDAIPGKEFPAEVLEVGVASTGVGTTFPVTVRLNKKDEAIRPGMTASVAIKFESRDERERFIVPSHAVVEDHLGRFVYVVEPLADAPGYGTVQRHTVTVGEITADGLEIFEGLSDGDLVVTAGVSRIKTGQKVRI